MNPSILLTLAALSVLPPSHAGEQEDTCPPCPCEMEQKNSPIVVVGAISKALEPAESTLKESACKVTYNGARPQVVSWKLTARPSENERNTWDVSVNWSTVMNESVRVQAEGLRGIIYLSVQAVSPGAGDKVNITIYCHK